MTRNSGTSTSSHLGAILLVDANNGIPLAMINGAEVTAKRTAAASALATQFLARENSSVLTIVGTGEQARSHLEAMLLVRDINEVRICGRKIEGAEQFISDNHLGESIKYVPHDDVTEALQGSDIVCTVTSAVSPFLSSEQMESGMPRQLSRSEHARLSGGVHRGCALLTLLCRSSVVGKNAGQ